MKSEGSVTGILRSAASKPELATELEKFRRNLTVLFTDIKGSTAYFERFGDAAGLVMVHRCNTLLGIIAECHGGRVVKTIGDSIMAAFEDSVAAVSACVEMQKALALDNAGKPPEERVSIRIGANLGMGIVKQSDVFGDVVNVASRVESAASPGQIVISDSLRQTIPDDAPFLFRYLGRFALKGKTDAHDLYEVVWRDTESAPEAVAHTMISADRTALPEVFTIQCLRSDGSIAAEYEVKRFPFTIGRSEGDLNFPSDPRLQPCHARLLLEDGQMFVDPMDDAPVFFSLIGPYRLHDGVLMRLGQHYFEFRVGASALASAAAAGVTLADLTSGVEAAPAELVSLADEHRYALIDEQIILGRGKATFVFPDDMLMSRAHAKIYHRGEDFFLEDAGSRNGTFVKAGPQTPLPSGSILSLGGQLLRPKRS